LAGRLVAAQIEFAWKTGKAMASKRQNLIVIPTRNRSDLARDAIRSVLDQGATNLSVMVSDNSTSQDESEQLAAYCRQLKTDSVRYVRPPQPLPMPEHWEWAMKQALADSSASHISYLTDRMVFKRGELVNVISLSERFPDQVISYNNDIILDYAEPVQLKQASWTGRVFELNTAGMILASAQVSTWLFFYCTPRMLNTIVPREVLNRIIKRFGNLFLSLYPDLSFAYKCLETLESILYYDRSVLISYAHSRSNGASYHRGVITKDYADFLANLNGKTLNYAAPIPELMTATNAAIHEYCFLKAESQSAKFPDIDLERYLSSVAAEISSIEDPKFKKEMESLLEKHRLNIATESRKSLVEKLQVLAAKLARLSPRWLVSLERPQVLWNLLEDRFGVERRGFNDKIREFETVEAALKFGERNPRVRNWGASLAEAVTYWPSTFSKRIK